MINTAHLSRCCLLLEDADSCVTSLTLESPCFRRVLVSVRIGEKFLRLRRAEGLRSQCMVAMCLCLPAADRVLSLSFRRYDICFSNVACVGVVSFKRGIYCGGLCVCGLCV